MDVSFLPPSSSSPGWKQMTTYLRGQEAVRRQIDRVLGFNYSTKGSHQPGPPSQAWEQGVEMNAYVFVPVYLLWCRFICYGSSASWNLHFSNCTDMVLCLVIPAKGLPLIAVLPTFNQHSHLFPNSLPFLLQIGQQGTQRKICAYVH